MGDFEDSTLWRASEFERYRRQTGNSGYARLEGSTILPTTLLADLHQAGVGYGNDGGDVLEVMAACLRHCEPALIYLQHQGLVWPVTVFPVQGLYHCPRDMVDKASIPGLGALGMLNIEAPGVRPPGDRLHERVAHPEHYRPLAPLLWTLALYGPRRDLLEEIAGTAAYRALSGPDHEGLDAPGALGSALLRLQRESVSLREMATWPGLTVERACRLLNALYLASGLMVTRTIAPSAPGFLGKLLKFLH